jgi:hypothetical protein
MVDINNISIMDCNKMQVQSVFPNSQEKDENSKMRVKQIHKLESSK